MIKTGKGFEMRLSDGILKALAKKVLMYITKDNSDIVSDENPLLDPEVIHAIMNFFLDMGDEKDLDLPSTETAISYTVKMMKEYNGTDAIKKIIEKLLEPIIMNNTRMSAFGRIGYFVVTNKTSFAVKLGPYLEKDGYKLVAVRKIVENAKEKAFYYRVLDKNEFVKDITEIETNKAAKDIKEEAEKRFAEENYPATITNCFTLVETVIKNILDDRSIKYKESARFITLYPLLADALNLNPAGENIESHLQKVLQGLKSQVEGLYHLANKASSRHTPKHIPKRQDAKLAMNTAFTLCEYLFDTHKSQQAQ